MRESSLASDSAFALWGAIRSLPAQLGGLQKIHWPSLQAVGWPDANSIYVRQGELKETVNGHPASATRWVQRDGSRPMDLVVGADNRFLAGIDPNNDFVLVRRGYERFTTVGRWSDAKVSAAK